MADFCIDRIISHLCFRHLGTFEKIVFGSAHIIIYILLYSMLGCKKYGKKDFEFVFLHGFCEDARMWSEFIEEFGGNAISIDLPGYGDSSHMEVTSLEEMAAQLHHTIQELGVKDFILAGHSMGGYVAMEYLSRFPENLNGVALIHSHPFADDDERKDQRKKTIDFIENYGVEAFVKQFFPKLFAAENQDNFAIHSLSLRATQLPLDTVINSVKAMMNRKDHLETYKNSPLPVCMIIGKEDQLIHFRDCVEITVEPRQSMVEIYDHVGHQSIFEKPQLLRSSLRKFQEFCKVSTSV